jgi:amino acid adenylation domain-containing protein
MTRNVATLLWKAADERPAHPAIVERERVTTYRTLRERASAVAAALLCGGVKAQDRVAILLERGPDAAAAIYATQAVGAIAVVINDRSRPRQIEYVIEHAGASTLLSTGEMLGRQPRPLDVRAEFLDIGAIAGGTRAFAPVSVSDSDVAQLIYTSGSTGMPKGVALTHANLRNGLASVLEYLALRADDRVASLLPFSSVYGLNQLISTIAARGTLVIESSPFAAQVVATMREQRVTVMAAVPPLWSQLLSVHDFAEHPILSLRQMQNAGGHLSPALANRLRAAQPQARLFLQYGMTETIRSTFLPPDWLDRKPGSMGRAMPGAEILVLREDGTPCEVGEVGELVHRGPTVAAGYWNDPEATARTFRQDPLRADSLERVVYSGDLVSRDADGFLFFAGRRDRMIKTLGFRVGPDEVADVLYASGHVAEAVVVPEQDETLWHRIVAHIVLTPDGSLEALKRYCRTELPRHMQPSRFEVRDAIPRMVSGKYDLVALTGSQGVTVADRRATA